jgi:hypothetical protein
LYAFIKEGESNNALKKLKTALKANKFVAGRLLSANKTTNLPGMHGIGDENEADYYSYFAHKIWKKTNGAIEWLKKNS